MGQGCFPATRLSGWCPSVVNDLVNYLLPDFAPWGALDGAVGQVVLVHKPWVCRFGGERVR